MIAYSTYLSDSRQYRVATTLSGMLALGPFAHCRYDHKNITPEQV
jgi:hypothetical protein